MPRTTLTRRVRFSAAHRYHRPEWSEARNQEVFGACGNPHGHGHNYVLEVTVAAPVSDDTGFCVDLMWVDALLEREVVRPLDHQHLNYVVPEFAPGGDIPTSEKLAAWIWERLAPAFTGDARLERLRLSENDDLWVELAE